MHDPWSEEVTLRYLQSFQIYWLRKNFIKNNIPLKQGIKIIEVGSGPAHDSLVFAESGGNVTAVDISENGLKSAKRIYLQAGYHIDVVKADIINLPFSEDYFDLTWNAGVLEHFDNGILNKVFKEMVRVTKENGIILIFVPNPLYFWYQLYLKKTKKRQYEFERAYSIFKLKKLFKTNGLKDVKVSGVHVHPALSYLLPKTNRLTIFFSKLFKPLENSLKFGFLKSLLGLDICIWGYKR